MSIQNNQSPSSTSPSTNQVSSNSIYSWFSQMMSGFGAQIGSWFSGPATSPYPSLPTQQAQGNYTTQFLEYAANYLNNPTATIVGLGPSPWLPIPIDGDPAFELTGPVTDIRVAQLEVVIDQTLQKFTQLKSDRGLLSTSGGSGLAAADILNQVENYFARQSDQYFAGNDDQRRGAGGIPRWSGGGILRSNQFRAKFDEAGSPLRNQPEVIGKLRDILARYADQIPATVTETYGPKNAQRTIRLKDDAGNIVNEWRAILYVESLLLPEAYTSQLAVVTAQQAEYAALSGTEYPPLSTALNSALTPGLLQNSEAD